MKSSKSGLRLGFESVFVRCAAVMALTTVVVAGAMALQSMRMANGLAIDAVVSQANKAVRAEAEALVKPIRFKVMDKIQESVTTSMLAVGEDGRAAVVIGADGTVLAQWGADDTLVPDLTVLAEQALETGAREQANSGMHIAEPILAAPDGPVVGVVVMAFGADAALASVRRDSLSMLAWAGGIFAVMMILTALVLKRLLGRPMTQLEQAVERVASGDYDASVDLQTRKDEFGQIARQLALLVQALSTAQQAELARAAKLEEQLGMVDMLGLALNKLATGALNHRLDAPFPEEYETLRNNFNSAVDSLRRTIGNVSENASSLLNGANEISRASDDLARRTETQAATLEQSAAALEELLNSVNASAGNAAQADQAVNDATDIAKRNGAIMAETITAMSEIEKSSEQISDITSVIDDIAFQTNLLALNAGVEAARAGSSGKGFAVVAAEVRGLAQRSAEAAQQIKDLIIASETQVENGVKLVERAGSALSDMVDQVSEISSMVTDIARGAGEQAHGLQEINVGIANLDSVTQQNAAMVEEATASAHMLREDATQLGVLVAEFEVDESQADSVQDDAQQAA